MSERLTPKFLTRELAEKAVKLVMGGILFNGLLDGIAKAERMGHIVVLVPSVEDARAADYPNWPDYPIKPFLLFEKSYGDRDKWTSQYDNIAKCKAQQLWRGQNFDGNTDVCPHLLFPDDTLYYGGVYRHGIVVAFSGDKSRLDQMLSGMVADAIKALAGVAFDESDDKAQKRAFLS